MVCFSVIGDMGSGNKLQFKVAKSLTNIIKNNNCKFVCGLGDNIYDSGCNSPEDKQFITKFEIPYRNIPDNIKFFMCLGNHDYGYHQPEWRERRSVISLHHRHHEGPVAVAGLPGRGEGGRRGGLGEVADELLRVIHGLGAPRQV